jgi:hypothetical protein
VFDAAAGACGHARAAAAGSWGAVSPDWARDGWAAGRDRFAALPSTPAG